MEMVFNGGEPLKDCPTDWETAREWQRVVNEKAEEENDRPKWAWDCGFKLDYDGPIVRISSRFYPPKTHYGAKWDGSVDVYIFDEKVLSKSFECENLEALRLEVESLVTHYKNIVKSKLK